MATSHGGSLPLQCTDDNTMIDGGGDDDTSAYAWPAELTRHVAVFRRHMAAANAVSAGLSAVPPLRVNAPRSLMVHVQRLLAWYHTHPTPAATDESVFVSEWVATLLSSESDGLRPLRAMIRLAHTLGIAVLERVVTDAVATSFASHGIDAVRSFLGNEHLGHRDGYAADSASAVDEAHWATSDRDRVDCW